MGERFNLYYTYNYNNPNPLTAKQKNIVIKKISSLTDQQRQNLFMLICEHAKRNDYDMKQIYWNNTLPYDGTITDEISFDMNKFPNELQNIIYSFLNM
jgi:hypothetical protein